MDVKVKICGLRNAGALDAALRAGADMIGLVLFEKSPRNVSLEQAAALAEIARGRVQIVAVTVDPDDALMDEFRTCVRPDFVQLHGAETPQRAREIAIRSGAQIIKAIKIAGTGDASAATAFNGFADLILFDALSPKDALPGGNGVAFDWRALDGVTPGYVLSGGLTPDNVADAVALLKPYAVDASSGVESAPGNKDEALIERFIVAAKQEMVHAS